MPNAQLTEVAFLRDVTAVTRNSTMQLWRSDLRDAKTHQQVSTWSKLNFYDLVTILTKTLWRRGKGGITKL